MTDENQRDPAVARGQRISDEVRFETAPDGKQTAKSARPHTGVLPRDMNTGEAKPATTEDVTYVAKTPSAWEAKEVDDRPDRRSGAKTPR